MFWPIGHYLADLYGWRGGLQIFAVISLSTTALDISLPRGRYSDSLEVEDELHPSIMMVRGNKTVLAILYATIIALGSALHAGMSAHLISMLSGLWLGVGVAVSVAALRGVGQSTARLVDVVFSRQTHLVNLNLIAAIAMPTCFVIGLLYGNEVLAAAVFTFAYGGAVGILTITSGTLPLELFDHRTYGQFVGKLLVPSFLLSALARLAFVIVMDALGTQAALLLAIAMGTLILLASLALKIPGGGRILAATIDCLRTRHLRKLGRLLWALTGLVSLCGTEPPLSFSEVDLVSFRSRAIADLAIQIALRRTNYALSTKPASASRLWSPS